MKKYGSYVMTVMGVALLCVGLLLVKTLHEPQGILKTLPYIIVGLGCGAFGCGAGNVLSQRTVRKHPEIQKQMEIDANDERNTAIANRAKAKAYDMMVFVFGALILAFAIKKAYDIKLS
ncbi:MAG: hypothetical protein RR956_06760 [Christensenella sp.]